ncbi:MAG TPA: chemotaxis protein CheB [Stellaceae bacterium]|jgi:two-component system CheB/CheR fusion protein
MSPNLPIVGIGASAGGVEALGAFFRAMPADNGMAFVVVTHLPPNRESLLADILGRATNMPVVDARDGDEAEAEHVYVLPAGATLTIADGRLQLRRTGAAEHQRAPIDVFFTSLAEDQAERAIGIVLSGGGSDGTLGLKAIKENGGLTVAQGSNMTRPRFADMPSSAVAAGFVDLLLPVEDIPLRIIAYVRDWGRFDPRRPGDLLSRIYSLLNARTGYDFSEYKERAFLRRVQRRMQVVQITELEGYVARLQADPDEVNALFRDLLIGVTGFFRDAAAFGALETLVMPRLLQGRGADDEVRVWVPGCATGEEAYSLAILLREQIDRLAAPPKVQIFATDIDAAAVGVARAGRYPANLLNEVSPERLKRFFVPESGSYIVAKSLRELCVFSNHSVIRDPPFSRLDMISCRNLLIYLKTELQDKVFPVFHYALRPGGCLFLGFSESISRYTEMFLPIDKKNRVFQRRELGVQHLPPRLQFAPSERREGAVSRISQRPRPQRPDLLRKAADAIVEHFAPTYVIVDEFGDALYFSTGTGKYLQAAAGPPTRDIVAMARPGLRADLRAALHLARETGRRVARDRIEVQINGGVQMIGLVVEPISEGKETAFGVVFLDHGPVEARDSSGGSGRPPGEDGAVQQIERELQETKDRLQSTIEELEGANEEFRSANEEMLSVNEELQSSNEELETSKEELESVNEELQTVNSELSYKIDELDRANSDLSNLFQSTQIATVFLDKNLAIRSFTPAVTRLFNLIQTDRGRPLTDIASRVAYPRLEPDIRAVLSGSDPIERPVNLADGNRHYLARVLPYRGASDAIDGVLLTFVDVTSLVAAEEQQKVLAAELSHRVKNTLAVVASIAERSLPDSEAKRDLIGRYHALGHTHEVLSQGGWTDAPLRELIMAELTPHTAGDGANVLVDGPPVMLKPQAALFLTLVIHELTTNAAKHGALSVPEGRVEVVWGIAGERRPGIELNWRESGGPAFDGVAKRGFGLELIERGIRFELQGEATIGAVDGGLDCKITVPANPENLVFSAAPDSRRLQEAAS